MARARNASATNLANLNAHCIDNEVEFVESTHVYYFRGIKIPISGTGVVHDVFDPTEEFDAKTVVDKYFSWWKRNNNPEYAHILNDKDLNETEQKEAIINTWNSAGVYGTALHTSIEIHIDKYYANNEWTTQPVLETDHIIADECKQFEEFTRSKWVHDLGLKPYRTELTVVYFNCSTPVCAGQIDGLFVDKHGAYYIFDWKRVKPKYLLTKDEQPYRGKCAYVYPHIPNTKFNKFSFQMSLYAVMLEESHGILNIAGFYVVRMHRDLPSYQLIQCTDYRIEARIALDALPLNPDVVPVI